MPAAAKCHMEKKCFVRARIAKKQRWYIDYTVFHTDTGQESRHRKEFNLNAIANIEVRQLVAENICTFIEDYIPQVNVAPVVPAKKAKVVSVKEAADVALAEKMKLPRENSRRTYKSVHKALVAWLAANKLADMPATDFTKKFALQYWDFLTAKKKYRAATLNNYRIHLQGMWSEMIARELTTVNPWAVVKVRNTEEKLRRPFTEAEMRIVAAAAREQDYWLFRSILLQYYCYVRPVEITRLKFRDFDLGKGVVTVQSGNAKKWKKRICTIPASVLPFFRDGRFDKYPGNYFVLGKKDLGGSNYRLEPCTVAIGDDRMYKRHQALLKSLQEQGLLGDVTGLTYYSWKDTGITRHAKQTTVTATKEQAGHTNLAVTSVYYHSDSFNPEYHLLENDLF